MLCFGSGRTKGDPDQEKRSKDIDKQLERSKKKLKALEKLLLLGAGESGKSTFLKQMKILHLDGFTDEEMKLYKNTVIQNCIIVAKNIIEGSEQLGIPIQVQDNQDIADDLMDIDPLQEDVLTPEVADSIEQLWNDPGIQETWTRSNEFKIQDTADYFFEHVKRISSEDFEPTRQDILYSRVKTTGIVEVDFKISAKSTFKIIDVGGQRSERKKWINCFDDVTAVIFFAALSAYDQFLREEESVNRMKEALSLWEEIANHNVFKNTTIILFLNKVDLFRNKLKKSKITACFPEYKGKHNFDATSRFIRERFVELRHTNKKKLRCHFTCSTDTKNIETIFDNVKEIIIQDSLEGSGIG